MRTLSKKLLPLTLFAIAFTSLFSVQPALGFTVTLEQVGANVVATGSGAINLTGLTIGGATVGTLNPFIWGNEGRILTGPGGFATLNIFSGFTGPTSFGSGSVTLANSGSGDLVGILPPLDDLLVPFGYVSGTALSSTATWNSATITSLGLTPGTYEWTWGTGLANQNFTLVIPAVPDGGSTVSLLGCALLGLAALRRKLGC